MPEMGLALGLRQVRLDADVVLACEVTAAGQELVATVQGDRRPKRGTDLVAIERPRAEQVPAHAQVLFPRRRAKSLDLPARGLGQRFEQARQRLPERPVRHHRRDHRTDADLRVGARGGVDALHRRRRQLEVEVIAGGAAAAHELDGGELRREVLVFQRAVAIESSGEREQQLERHPIAEDAAPQPAVGMRVGVHEAGEQQPVVRVDDSRGRRGRQPRPADLADRVVLDQDIGRLGSVMREVKHSTAADDRRRHGASMPAAGRSVAAGPAYNKRPR
jgi:hypothetical protein